MRIIKGFLDSFLPHQNAQQQIMSIPSVMPTAAIQSIQNGKLPQINTNTIFLTKGEICHYIERAILVTEKNMITGYTGGSSGWSFRVMRGVNYRVGKRNGVPIREDVKEFNKGTLYITSKRIIFVSKKNGFDKKINSITAVSPYSNAIILQFGSSSYPVMLPDGNIAFNTLNLLKQ